MKHTVIFTPACGESASMPADLCSGLRRSISGALVPRPPLETFANGSWMPLCTVTDSGSPDSTLLAATDPDKSGRYPLAMVTAGNPVPEVLGSLESEIRCATPTCYGAAVMTADGPQHIIRDRTSGRLSLAGMIPPVRPVRIEAESRGTISMTIGPETITGGSAATIASSKSFAEFSGRMMHAYSETILRTSTAGLWIQPVAVFYRLRATDGNVLYTSPVRIVSAAGWQGTSGTAVQCSVDSSGSGIAVELPAFSVAFETYRLKVTIPDEILPGEWNRLVSSVEICVSPQMHPVDLKSKAACMLTGGQSAPTFTVALPGATSRMASLDSRRRSATIEMAAIVPLLARTETVLSADDNGEHHVSNSHPHSVAEDCASISSGLRKNAPRDNGTASGRLLSDITPPHSFAARTVAVDGDSALWADITPLPFPGFQPGEWVAADDNSGQTPAGSEWDALSIVTLDDGRRLTALSSGNGFRPTAIGPLLHYPSPHARVMEFWVRKSTSVYKASVKLSPDSAGTGAWFLNSSLDPVELQPTSEKMPDAGTTTAPGPRQSGFLVSAPSTAMLNPVSCVECSRGCIGSLVAASRSLSSWDFSRSHIYAFASDGIYAVAVNAANRIASASHINSRGTDCRNTVAKTDEAVMALPADGGGALLVKASKATPLAMPGRFIFCAASLKNGEVWLSDADGRVRIMASDGTFSRIGEVARMLHCAGGIPLVDNGSRLLRQSDSPAEINTIEWKHTVRTDLCSAVCAVTWLISASMFEGTLSVRAHGGSGQTYPVTACNVEGMVNSPVMLRVVSPPRPYVSLEIKASVSGDFRFEGVELHMTKPFRP